MIDLQQTRRTRVKWLMARMKLTELLMRIAQASCMHVVCSIHQGEDGEYFSVCGQCGEVES